VERVSTGNRQLDEILGGGFLRGSINVIAGRPGAGKTMLAEQLAFAVVPGGRPVLYLTTLSEPLAKVLTYLQHLDFAEIDRVGRDLLFESLAEPLAEGPEALIERVRALMLKHRPQVMIIDSFKAIADLMADVRVWRRTVFDLAATFSAYDVTVFWIGEYLVRTAQGLIELAVADGILELQREDSGSRDDRFLQVAKLRGSDFADGRHAYRLGAAGLEVFPRLRTPSPPRPGELPNERLSPGVAGLDSMIEGGLLRGTSTLVAGPSGSGKTLIGMHFLREGVRCGEPGLLVGFQESPGQLSRMVESLGWSAGELLRPGRIELLYNSPVELHIDAIAEQVLRRVEQQGVRRVLVDSLGDLELAAGDWRRFADYIYALTQHFMRHGVTAFLTLEGNLTRDQEVLTRRPISQTSDNTLLLAMELADEELVRTLRVIKARGSTHEGRRRPLRITAQGATVV